MEFDRDKYRELLLSSIPSARKASDGNEIVCRCFYCPDSKDLSHGHFYISIPSNDNPSMFYCQKCQTCGFVTHETLMEWGIYDVDISASLAKYNKRIKKLAKNNKMVSSDTIYKVTNRRCTQSALSDLKLRYINNRLGTNLDYGDIMDSKIILSLKDFLEENNIRDYTRDPRVIDQLDHYFIGFLSYDNGFINMRNLSKGTELIKSIDKRYVNYNIFGKYDNTKRFYIKPVLVNLVNPEPIRIHLTEGVFDTLSVYHNLRRNPNDIYASINGSGYMGMCRFFLTNAKLMNVEFHIYPDNDISDEKINRIIRQLSVFNYKIFIHKNIMKNEKDFGVPIERISEFITEF